MAEPEGSLLSPSCVPDSMGSLARHLVIPTLKTDFHREGIFRPSANRKRLSFAPTLTLTLTLNLPSMTGNRTRKKIQETQERSKGVSPGTLPATSGPAATAGLRKSAGPPASAGSQTKCRKVSEVSEGEGSFTPLTR